MIKASGRKRRCSHLFCCFFLFRFYTNLGQIWQGPLNGSGTAPQYLYCDSTHSHQLKGVYPLGTTCASPTGATYTASYDAWGNLTSRTYNAMTATLT